MSDIQDVLRAWGKWARSNSDMGLGYGQPMEVIMRGAPEADVNELRIARYDDVDFICDDRALVVDRIVGVLCRIKPVEGECLRLRYVNGWNVDRIGKHLTANGTVVVGKFKAAQYVASAEGFCDGYIANM